MKFSYLMRRRKKGLIPDETKVRRQDETGPSGIFDSLLQSGLTKSGSDDKIKKDKVIFTLDHAGDIKKVSQNLVRKKATLPKKGFDFRNLNIGYYILIPIIGGTIIGLTLDYQFRTKPFFFGLFLFFGTIAGFYNLFKLLKNE